MLPGTELSRWTRFGKFELDARAGELRTNNQRLHLQEQPLQVLMLLLDRAGNVVTREELCARLWPEDTFVDFEGGLNHAVRKLREALGDTAEKPRFIETVPKRGYRFICPIYGAEVADLPRKPERDRVEPLLHLRATALAAAALLVVIGATIGYRYVRKFPNPTMRLVPLTSFPGHQTVARFSPDGNRIAFVWDGEKEDNWDIYVKQIGEEKPLRLTTDPGPDVSPAWSPDGRYIAFYRHTEREDGIYVIPALGGAERKLGSVSHGGLDWEIDDILDWSPDGKYLAYLDRQHGEQGLSIFVMAVDSPDQKHPLTSPPGAIHGWGPRFSPDGRTIAFNAGDLYKVSVGGGDPSRLTFDRAEIRGLDWTPDGAYIIFSSARGGDLGLWKTPASGGEPERLSVGQGGAILPAISRDGRRLAYRQRSVDINIWRYENSKFSGRSLPPTKLIASTQWNGSQQFSPDGKRIVFASGRSGSIELWVCDSEGSNPRQLTFVGGSGAGTPRWSPDGRQVVFDCNARGKQDIYVVSVEGGPPRRLTSEKSQDVTPSWSRDGRWIYFASDRTGNWQVWKMPAEGGKAVQVTKHGGFAALESVDGKMLYYAKGTDVPGLWRVPVEGGEETPILPQLGASLWGYWGLTAEGIYFYNESAKAIEFLSFTTHKVRQIAKPEKDPDSSTPGLAVSPDGRWILYAQQDKWYSNIMLVENFRW